MQADHFNPSVLTPVDPSQERRNEGVTNASLTGSAVPSIVDPRASSSPPLLQPLPLQPQSPSTLPVDPENGRVVLNMKFTSLVPTWEGSAFSHPRATQKSPDVQKKELRDFMANNWNLETADPYFVGLFEMMALAKCWQ